MNENKKVIFTDPIKAAQFIAELEKQQVEYVIENTSLQDFVIRVFIIGFQQGAIKPCALGRETDPGWLNLKQKGE